MSKLNTGIVADMRDVCKKLKEIKGLDNWDTCNVEHMTGMFYNCIVTRYI